MVARYIYVNSSCDIKILKNSKLGGERVNHWLNPMLYRGQE